MCISNIRYTSGVGQPRAGTEARRQPHNRLRTRHSWSHVLLGQRRALCLVPRDEEKVAEVVGNGKDQEPRSSAKLQDVPSEEIPQTITEQTAEPLRAVREGVGLGFSAGGFLFAYHIGTLMALDKLGIVQPGSQMAGASAGSLVIACYNSGMDLNVVAESTYDFANNCRREGTRHRLRSLLGAYLDKYLPKDAHKTCSGSTHVALTQAIPFWKPVLVSSFHSREDLISALLASCHIPWYVDGRWVTKFRDRYYMDGGVLNFIPAPPKVENVVKVCCFPTSYLQTMKGYLSFYAEAAKYVDVSISPDRYDNRWPTHLRGIEKWQQMLNWGLVPSDNDTLRMFIEKGQSDAMRWAEVMGISDGVHCSKPQEIGEISSAQHCKQADTTSNSPKRAQELW